MLINSKVNMTIVCMLLETFVDGSGSAGNDKLGKMQGTFAHLS